MSRQADSPTLNKDVEAVELEIEWDWSMTTVAGDKLIRRAYYLMSTQ